MDALKARIEAMWDGGDADLDRVTCTNFQCPGCGDRRRLVCRRGSWRRSATAAPTATAGGQQADRQQQGNR